MLAVPAREAPLLHPCFLELGLQAGLSPLHFVSFALQPAQLAAGILHGRKHCRKRPQCEQAGKRGQCMHSTNARADGEKPRAKEASNQTHAHARSFTQNQAPRLSVTPLPSQNLARIPGQFWHHCLSLLFANFIRQADGECGKRTANAGCGRRVWEADGELYYLCQRRHD